MEVDRGSEWVRCVAWNKQADIAGRFVTKGKVVFVEGRLQTRQFEDRKGATRTVTEVVVASLRVLGGTKNEGRGGNNRDATAAARKMQPGDQSPFERAPNAATDRKCCRSC